MKKFIALVFVAAALFFGCSNTDNSSEKWLMASLLQNKTSHEDEIVINLKGSKQDSRALFPSNIEEIINDYDNIKWGLYCTPSETNTYSGATEFFCNVTSSGGKISFQALKKGIYNIRLTGTYTDASGTAYYCTGIKNDVNLESYRGKELDLEVSFVQAGTGSYSFKIEFDRNWLLDQITAEKVSIKIQSFVADDNQEQYQPDDVTLSSETAPDSGETVKVIFTATKAQMKAGFYQIIVSLTDYENNGWYVNPVNIENMVLSDSILAVSADMQTTGTISACYSLPLKAIRSEYYATNDESVSGNGLYYVTRGYVWDIISTILKADWPSNPEPKPEIKIYCDDFILDVSKYNTLFKADAADTSFDGYIMIIAENAKYLFTKDYVSFPSGAIKLCNSQTVENPNSYTDLAIRYSDVYVDSCRFTDNVVVISADRFTSNVYIKNPGNYISSDKPFMKITKAAVDEANELITEPAYQLKYFTDDDGDGNFDSTPSVSNLEIYIYDESKDTYYKESSCYAVCELADSETYNIYLKKTAITNILDIQSYVNLNVTATGFVKNVAKTYSAGLKGIKFDYGADDGIAFEAEHNSDCTGVSYAWKLNGRNYYDASTQIVVIPYSDMLVETTNYVSCTATWNSMDVSSTIEFTFDGNTIDTNWVAYLDKFTSSSKKIKSYTEDLDTAANVGSSDIFENTLTLGEKNYDYWNFNDGYLYVKEDSGSGAFTLNTYRMNGASKKLEFVPISDSVNGLLSETDDEGNTYNFEVMDIVKYNNAYYLLLRKYNSEYNNYTSTAYYKIAYCSAISKDLYDVENDYASITSDFLAVTPSMDDKFVPVFAQFAVYGDYIYLADNKGATGSNYDKNEGIYKIAVTYGENYTIELTDSSKTITKDIAAAAYAKSVSTNEGITTYTSNFPLLPSGNRTSGLYSYTDMAVINNKLYCTMEYHTDQLYGFDFSASYVFLGGIVCLDIGSDGALTVDSTFGTDGLYGAADVTHVGPSNDYTIYGPYGNKNPKSFFGVQKILAVKEEYLLLQDCGVYIKQNDDSYRFFNSDRIVYFDLNSKSIDTTKTRTDFVMNEKNTSGCVIIY